MSTDSIGYPLPVFVKGFACLTGKDVELARKHIDPARPQDGPYGRDAPASKIVDPARVEAAQKDAVERGSQVVSYAPGSVRTVAIDTGTAYSVEA